MFKLIWWRLSVVVEYYKVRLEDITSTAITIQNIPVQ